MILPNEIINKIQLYVSHPTADMIRAIVAKYQEVIIMRLKNRECIYLSFYQTWKHIELDQAKIDKIKQQLYNVNLNGIDFDF